MRATLQRTGMCIYVCVCVCVFVYLCVCMCVCVYVSDRNMYVPDRNNNKTGDAKNMYVCVFEFTNYVCIFNLLVLFSFVCMYVYTYTDFSHIDTYIHRFAVPSSILTYIHTYMHRYIHTYIHTQICSPVHTYMHTCIHTYIHTYIDLQSHQVFS